MSGPVIEMLEGVGELVEGIGSIDPDKLTTATENQGNKASEKIGITTDQYVINLANKNTS